MLKSFFTIDDEESTVDETDIDWLDKVIQTANSIFAQLLQEIQAIAKRKEDIPEE